LSLKTLRPILAVLLILALAASYLLLRREGNTAADASEASASLIPLLADESSLGFARATVPGAVEFPRDLGTHDEYQTEWWYYTGNLETAAGEQFGFQLTFFRRALPVDPDLQGSSLGAPQSDWRTNQVYLAHFTVSDIGQNAFYPAERFSRPGLPLPGVAGELVRRRAGARLRQAQS
jgi:predicted secreted hydrolase